MATKKKAAKKKAAKKKGKATVAISIGSAKLRWDPHWFTDPGPDIFKRISPAAAKALKQLKVDVEKRVNEILKIG